MGLPPKVGAGQRTGGSSACLRVFYAAVGCEDPRERKALMFVFTYFSPNCIALNIKDSVRSVEDCRRTAPAASQQKRQHVGFWLGRRCAGELLLQQTTAKIIDYFKLQKNGKRNSLNTQSSHFAAPPHTWRSHIVAIHSQLYVFSFVPVPISQFSIQSP